MEWRTGDSQNGTIHHKLSWVDFDWGRAQAEELIRVRICVWVDGKGIWESRSLEAECRVAASR